MFGPTMSSRDADLPDAAEKRKQLSYVSKDVHTPSFITCTLHITLHLTLQIAYSITDYITYYNIT